MDWQVYLAKAKSNLHTAQSAYAQGDFDSISIPVPVVRISPFFMLRLRLS